MNFKNWLENSEPALRIHEPEEPNEPNEPKKPKKPQIGIKPITNKKSLDDTWSLLPLNIRNGIHDEISNFKNYIEKIESGIFKPDKNLKNTFKNEIIRYLTNKTFESNNISVNNILQNFINFLGTKNPNDFVKIIENYFPEFNLFPKEKKLPAYKDDNLEDRLWQIRWIEESSKISFLDAVVLKLKYQQGDTNPDNTNFYKDKLYRLAGDIKLLDKKYNLTKNKENKLIPEDKIEIDNIRKALEKANFGIREKFGCKSIINPYATLGAKDCGLGFKEFIILINIIKTKSQEYITNEVMEEITGKKLENFVYKNLGEYRKYYRETLED